MVRAIHEWCVDNGLTPHLLVTVNSQCRVPMAFVKDGEIVLNLNYAATKDLHIDNEAIVFSARFNGVSQNLYVPMGAVKGIFARENGQGMYFETSLEPVIAHEQSDEAPENVTSEPKTLETPKKKPTLTIVK